MTRPLREQKLLSDTMVTRRPCDTHTNIRAQQEPPNNHSSPTRTTPPTRPCVIHTISVVGHNCMRLFRWHTSAHACVSHTTRSPPTLRRCVPSVERGAQGSCVSANTKRECIELEPKKSAPLTRDRSGHSQHNLSARGIAEAMTIGAVRSKASKAIFSHH